VTFTASAIGSWATIDNVRTWYPTIAKPSWTPPNWLFGPVWTLLYTLMAIAAWRVWRNRQGAEARSVLNLYGSQLALNTLWSVLFFALHRPGLALIEISALWALLVHAQVRFWRADRTAGILWAPYLAWVSFATALNAAIWWLNR
jgi:tryptophan-rich sensory protein